MAVNICSERMKSPENFVAVPFKYHEEVEISIGDVTNLGAGVGRVNNWVVMVPFVCIGEDVVVKIYKNFKNYSLGDLLNVSNPSPHRVSPKCALFGICGGCQYQHMDYGAQLALKRHHVEDSMRKLAQVNVPVCECLHSGQIYHYRSKITPHFQKTVPPIGFLRCDSRRIIDVQECPIATERINDELKTARANALADKSPRKRGGTMLLRDCGGRIETNPKATAVQRIGDFEFSFRAGEFFQNNPFTLQLLSEYVASAASGTKYLIDAFCGVGLFGIIAAKHFEKILAVEIGESAIAFARRNAERNGVSNVNFLCGTAERIFEDVKFPGGETSVIIDPPRSGCSHDFLLQLMKFSPQKIVYVSCAPDTQARDLNVICQKYSVEKIQPFDMFPQTRHVENVVTLQR
ncbi:MAG: class I SAM-dependent RNA methyltransferase [Puniceicoccales bacterium]|jgi:23S rRNA (uracil1939-C5)-methyltransferase/tRNA (uracil-5-)-methyltransferase|nr:class I SAM-dependent RNA methyltransferase [Puniceicoccales bacterium]